MMALDSIFVMFVILFAIVGAARGWAKELLVSFSVILALALIHLLERYIPSTLNLPGLWLFWLRIIILLFLVFFGYQTVVSIPRLAAKATREKLQDTISGFIFGGINGYLVAGTILYYMYVAGYPFKKIIIPPTDPDLVNRVNNMMMYMPPQLLGEPLIYFAVILAFIFVIVVYI